jgi:hypothetical protein
LPRRYQSISGGERSLELSRLGNQTLGPTGVPGCGGRKREVEIDLLPLWDLRCGTKVTQGAWDVVDWIL